MPVLSVRAGTPHLPRRDPREATRLLRYALHRHGFPHTYQSDGSGKPALSVPIDLGIWCRKGLFVRNEEGHQACRPADGPVGRTHLTSRHHPGSIFGDTPSGGRKGSRARTSPPTGSVRD